MRERVPQEEGRMHADMRAIVARLAAADPDVGARVERWAQAREGDNAPGEATLASVVIHVRSVAAEHGPDEARATAAALARFGEAAGRVRITRWCTGESLEAAVTRGGSLEALIRGAEHDPLQAAVPVDLPDFLWGPPGYGEYTHIEGGAFGHVASALEEAIDAGELDPGAADWRQRRAAVIERALGQRAPTAPTEGRRTWRELVEEQRRAVWVAGATPRRNELAVAVVGELERGLRPPGDAHDAMAPLRWLLDALADGVTLTRQGRAPKDLLLACSDAFSWPTGGALARRTSPRSEAPSAALGALMSAGLVARRDRMLHATDRGRVAAADPRHLWSLVTRSVLRSDAAWVWWLETALLLLAGQETWETSELIVELEEEARAIFDPDRRRTDVNWSAMTGHVRADLVGHGRALGFLSVEGRTVFTERLSVDEHGRRTVLALLDGRARGPRQRGDVAEPVVRRPELASKQPGSVVVVPG